MNIVIIIGAIILLGSFILHLYRVEKEKEDERGEKIVVVCLMIGFLLIAGPLLIEMGNRTCPSCETYYEADAKFCSECGTSLVTICPDCGVECDTPYCGNCDATVQTD